MAIPTHWDEIVEREWGFTIPDPTLNRVGTETHPIFVEPFLSSNERRETTVNIYRGRIDHEHFSPIDLQHVRDFIIGVNNDESITWRAGHATVQINSFAYRIARGSFYEKRDISGDQIIYLTHTPECTRPDWLTGVLSALAQYYGIDGEPEIVNAIINIGIQASINQFSSIQGAYLAATFSGVRVTDVAIKKGSNLLAGLCPPEKAGDPKVWRLRETGEIVTPDESWVTFSITGGL